MLMELVNFEESVTLISNTGVQFMDFGLRLDSREIKVEGGFVVQQSNCSLARLEYDEENNRYYHSTDPSKSVKPKLLIPFDESIALLRDIWLPVPILKR